MNRSQRRQASKATFDQATTTAEPADLIGATTPLEALLSKGDGKYIGTSTIVIDLDNKREDGLDLTDFGYQVPLNATITGMNIVFSARAIENDPFSNDYDGPAMQFITGTALDGATNLIWRTTNASNCYISTLNSSGFVDSSTKLPENSEFTDYSFSLNGTRIFPASDAEGLPTPAQINDPSFRAQMFYWHGGDVGSGVGSMDLEWYTLEVVYTLPATETRAAIIGGNNLCATNRDGALSLDMAMTSGLPLADAKFVIGGIPISTFDTGSGFALGVIDASASGISGLDWSGFSQSSDVYSYLGNTFIFHENAEGQNVFAIERDASGVTAAGTTVWRGVPFSLNSQNSIIANEVSGTVTNLETAVIGGVPFQVATVGGERYLVVGS